MEVGAYRHSVFSQSVWSSLIKIKGFDMHILQANNVNFTYYFCTTFPNLNMYSYERGEQYSFN